MAIPDCAGLTQARAVWDFTTGDERRFFDRLSLLMHAVESFKSQGVPADFVVLLHGPATKFAAKTFAGTKFEPEGEGRLAQVHGLMQRLADVGVRIEVCRIAMERCLIAADNLIPFGMVEENVFVNSIALQNKGYAYIPVA